MLLSIRHEAVCRYDHTVSYSIQHLRLTPRAEANQRALEWRIHAPGRQRQQIDAYGNVAHLLTLDHPHTEISIIVSGDVETADQDGHILHEPGLLSPLAYLADTPLTHADDALRDFAFGYLGPGQERFKALRNLMATIGDVVRLDRTAQPVSEGASTAFLRGHGGCEDQAHVFISCCRTAGIPARYVSGYHCEAGPGDAASHAWADAWLGGDFGWVSFDVTHQRLAGGEYCRLAVGRDYLDACPVRGVRRDGWQDTLTKTVRVAAYQQQH